MTVHKLRYTGARKTVFQTGNVGEVAPGGEFDVDEALLLRFMRRADVEHAGECPAPPCRCGEEPGPEPGPEPEMPEDDGAGDSTGSAEDGGDTGEDASPGAAEGETPPPDRDGEEPESVPEPATSAKRARSPRTKGPKQYDGEGAGSS